MGCAEYVGDERGKDVDRVPSTKSQGTGLDCLFTTQRERSRVHDVKSTATGEKRVRASHPKECGARESREAVRIRRWHRWVS